MRNARIAIVGAGLSGLYAAWLLERQGVRDYLLLEAREVLGGRIASVTASGLTSSDSALGRDRFDLGPTWFWPAYQRQLDHLVDTLGLARFEQFETGDMLLERSLDEPPVRMRGYGSLPVSMRLAGGMTALIEALRRGLDPTRIVTGQAVRRLRRMDEHVELDSVDDAGHITTWRAEHVLLALPPRLAEHAIDFEPALPPALIEQWRETLTWMAPHAKYIAIYDMPFWRAQGLSGEARSVRGPLGEIHDASAPGGSAALFGFLGLAAHARAQVSEAALRAHCRAQLARLFGPQAASPKADAIKDWAQDPYTSIAADLEAAPHHAAAPAAAASSGLWQGRLTGIASEWSPQFPGYIAGAVEAAHLGVQALVPPACR